MDFGCLPDHPPTAYHISIPSLYDPRYESHFSHIPHLSNNVLLYDVPGSNATWIWWQGMWSNIYQCFAMLCNIMIRHTLQYHDSSAGPGNFWRWRWWRRRHLRERSLHHCGNTLNHTMKYLVVYIEEENIDRGLVTGLPPDRQHWSMRPDLSTTLVRSNSATKQTPMP